MNNFKVSTVKGMIGMVNDKSPLILLVDDNPDNLKILAQVIEGQEYDVSFAMSGDEVFDSLSVSIPDLILLDVMMPGMDGFEVCEKLKSMEPYKDIPVIFLTARTDSEDLVHGFESGAVDYIAKPFHRSELLARVKTHLELKKSRDTLNEMLRRLEQLSVTDALTGIYNRRFLMEEMKNLKMHTERYGTFFSIAICDIDNFKNINDKFGHDYGDYVLKSITTIINNNIRAQDFFGRWGGEEFLLVLPNTDAAGAYVICEKLRSIVSNESFSFKDKTQNVTMTFGISQSIIDYSVDDTIKHADVALYKGKNSGKNRSEVYKVINP